MLFSNRESRDICRKLLGGPENVTFLVMNLTKDCQKKRLAHRHGDESDGSFAETLSKGQITYDVCAIFGLPSCFTPFPALSAKL